MFSKKKGGVPGGNCSFFDLFSVPVNNHCYGVAREKFTGDVRNLSDSRKDHQQNIIRLKLKIGNAGKSS